MTKKQEEKALQSAMLDFETKIKQGYQIDNKQTFAEYAAYVLELKERTGIRPRTIDRYRELLVRINQAIGHKKLSEIRPQHLNLFYKNLAESGIRAGTKRAVIAFDGLEWMESTPMSRAELSRRSNVSATTIASFMSGKPVLPEKAEAIAKAMGKTTGEAFTISEDTTPLSAKTILEYHRLISTIFSQAEKELLVPYNPAAKASPPKAVKNDPDYFQPEEVDRILEKLDTAPVKWKALTYLLIDTGCRRAEVAGLKWDDCDLEAGIITIRRNLLYSAKRGVYVGPTKNGKTRTLQIAPETVALLKEHWDMQEELRIANGDRWVDSGFVFTQENGEHMHPDSITDWLNKFSIADDIPHIHPHAFRHTAASTMIANGVDIITTAGELGHNPATTATYYSHIINEAKVKAATLRNTVFQRRKESGKKPGASAKHTGHTVSGGAFRKAGEDGEGKKE